MKIYYSTIVKVYDDKTTVNWYKALRSRQKPLNTSMYARTHDTYIFWYDNKYDAETEVMLARQRGLGHGMEAY